MLSSFIPKTLTPKYNKNFKKSTKYLHKKLFTKGRLRDPKTKPETVSQVVVS